MLFKKNIYTPILIAFLNFFFFEAFSQNQKKNATVPEFKNQGEQETYWTQQFFQKEYNEQKFQAFSGKVCNVGDVYIFFKDSLTVSNSDTEIKRIFSKGLLYPSLIGGNQISNVEELKTVEVSPQKRRFKFLLYREGMSNPMVCFFELTNKKSNGRIGLKEFVSDASLTFFKHGWLMI